MDSFSMSEMGWTSSLWKNAQETAFLNNERIQLQNKFLPENNSLQKKQNKLLLLPRSAARIIPKERGSQQKGQRCKMVVN
jgi:hypothetical protein